MVSGNPTNSCCYDDFSIMLMLVLYFVDCMLCFIIIMFMIIGAINTPSISSSFSGSEEEVGCICIRELYLDSPTLGGVRAC